MPIRWFKCTKCEKEFRSKKENPVHCEGYYSELILKAPNFKMQETDPKTGKVRMQDQDKILRERARNHSRDNDLDDLIQKNNPNDAKKNAWINEKGEKRKAIDDL